MKRVEDGEAAIPAFSGVLRAAVYMLELAVVAAVYFGLAESSLLLPSINPAATPLWPPTGFALALILLRGHRIWPAILAGASYPHFMAGRTLLEAGSVGVGITLAAIIGARLISRWCSGEKIFVTPATIGKFVLVSFVPTAVISSTIAVAAFALKNDLGFSDFVGPWATWWLADAAGTLIVVPVVMVWAAAPMRLFSRWRALESAAVYALVGAIGFVAYSPLITGTLVGSELAALLPY